MMIDESLVARLIAAQLPQWSDLPLTRVAPGGWDNRTFRLGAHLSVRLPSAPPYAKQVAKEQHWLPRLAPHLPLPIPTPVAMGSPSADFPWHWSVYRWLDGDTAADARIADTRALAVDLAHFLGELRRIDTIGGPPPGLHNFHRGAPLSIYDAQTREAIAALRDCIDGDAATTLWQSALDARFRGSPVWVHGDVAAGNLLLRDGVLSAVIDFGCCTVGDPACDFTIAWTLFDRAGRDTFRQATQVDDDTWTRGRGWALWKALITVVKHRHDDQVEAAAATRVLDGLLRL